MSSLRHYLFASILSQLIVSNGVVYGQCPAVDFSLPAEACLEERIDLTNLSSGDSYKWNFCPDQFSGSVNDEKISTNIAFRQSYTFQIAGDTGVALRNSGLFYQVNFDSKMNTVTDIIAKDFDFRDSLSLPRDIKFMNNNGNRYAFISNSGDQSVVRLFFGNSIQNVPDFSVLSPESPVTGKNGLEIVKTGNNYLLFAGDNSGNTIHRFDFGQDLSSDPVVTSFTVPDAVNIASISMVNTCEGWFGIVSSIDNDKVFRLHFNDGVLNDPDISELLPANGSFTQPAKSKVVEENGNYYGLIQSGTGNLYIVDFEFSLFNQGVLRELNTSVSTGYAIEATINPDGDWRVFSVDYVNLTRGLVVIDFTAPCSLSLKTSREITPIDLTYSEAGTYDIRLTAFDSQGNFNSIQKSIDIVGDTAPEIDWQSTGNCLEAPLQFTSASNQSLTSYLWDFGDGMGTSTEPNPSYQYSTADTFDVRLTVEADNGCSNFLQKPVVIYEAPIADFSVPSGLLCSNSSIPFTNISTGETGDIVQWKWNFDNIDSSMAMDTVYTFTSAGDKDISLTASIPGCADTVSQVIQLASGPATDFSFEDQCLGSEHQFTNLTTGEDIISYTWSFGDGGSSDLSDPTYLYDETGTYEIMLTAENDTGCITSKAKSTIVHARPFADFTYDYSCNGLPTSFTDNSTVADANITGWSWDFGDFVSNEEHPEYVFEEYGLVPVHLTVTSNYGCLDDTTIDVTVNPSPIADFNIEACMNTEAEIENQSIEVESHSIISWFWEIDESSYTDSIPSHTFHTTGSHTVRLTAEAENLCASQKEDTVYIDPPLNVGFRIDSPLCANQEVLLSDTTSLHNYSIEEWTWNIGEEVNITTQNQITYSFPDPGEQTIRLSVNTENNCYYTSDPVIVNIQPDPDPYFTTQFPEDSIVGAVPLKVELTNETTGATGYMWSMGDGNQFGFVDSLYTYNSEGHYLLSLKAYNEAGCSRTFTRPLTVLDPYLDIGISDVTAVVNNGWINFEIELINHGHVIVDSLEIEIEMDKIESRRKELFDEQLFVYPGSMTYALTIQFPEFLIENQYVCVRVTPKHEGLRDANPDNNLLCIDLTGETYFFNPYPNPSIDLVNIPFILPEEGEIIFSLRDHAGKLLMQRQFGTLPEGYHNIELDVRQFQAGVYLLTVSYRGKKKTFRIFLDH